MSTPTTEPTTDRPGVWHRFDLLLARLRLHRRPLSLLIDGAVIGVCWNIAYLFRLGFERSWQLLAANGFAVIGMNPRGSSGRGLAWAKVIYAHWGEKDVQDVLSGADYAVAHGIADPARLGVGGWSYGGELTNYVIASDARFKAAISGAGIGNVQYI